MYQLHPYQTKLVNQARQALANGNKSVLLQSPAGSGKSVIIAEIVRLTVSKGGSVMFMVHRKELAEQITNSFRENEVDLTRCTILTVGKIANRLKILPHPALIITDESHHSLAKTYRKIYDYYAGVPRLGFTATPWRLNGKGLHDVYDDMVLGPSID
ncbi:DEAD/DEAH box helicase, partial [Nocardia heshunensis]